MAQVRHVDVNEGRLDPEILRVTVADPSAGATALFTGDVRDNDHGRPVVSLSYEAHPSAKDVLAEVAQEIAERFDVIAVAVAHRHGPIPVGEAALVAAVSAGHREEAFAACISLVNLTKERIPIWKHQMFADGTDEWVNCA